MQIKQSTYDQLTPQQRVAATFQARYREDRVELDKLFNSCPVRRYTMTDSAYIDLHNRVMEQTLIVEYELLSLSLWLLYVEKEETDKNIVFSGMLRQKMADIQAGWEALLNELGIGIEAIEGQFIDRSPIMQILMLHLPPPTPEGTAQNLAYYRTYVINGEAPTQAC